MRNRLRICGPCESTAPGPAASRRPERQPWPRCVVACSSTARPAAFSTFLVDPRPRAHPRPAAAASTGAEPRGGRRRVRRGVVRTRTAASWTGEVQPGRGIAVVAIHHLPPRLCLEKPRGRGRPAAVSPCQHIIVSAGRGPHGCGSSSTTTGGCPVPPPYRSWSWSWSSPSPRGVPAGGEWGERRSATAAPSRRRAFSSTAQSRTWISPD